MLIYRNNKNINKSSGYRFRDYFEVLFVEIVHLNWIYIPQAAIIDNKSTEYHTRFIPIFLHQINPVNFHQKIKFKFQIYE